MCGIIGHVGTSCSTKQLDAARDLMKTRGPDAADATTIPCAAGSVYFGHRRLAILDLSDAGRQPMWSDCGRYVIVYNGEVYNSVALREELTRLGRGFRSTCDTEVIVTGFAEWGASIVERLTGMFAFGIWDSFEESLFLARDRMGMKPLLFAATDKGITFGSDARIFGALDIADAIDPEALALYLVFGYVPSPFAIWKGVRKLPPGHTLVWKAGHAPETPKCYWAPPATSDMAVPTVEEIEELIDAAVDAHLLSNVPVGVFLSGGLDSSLVASSAMRASPDGSLTAVSVGFPGSVDNESDTARVTADIIGLDWQELALPADLADAHFKTALATLDEPYAYSAIITQDAVSSVAAQHKKVMLSGDGGDEVFGGYRWYQDLDAKETRRTASLFGMKAARRKLERFASRSPLHRNLRRISGAFAPESAADIVAGISASQVSDLVDGILDQYDAPGLPLKRRLQRLDLMTFCADCICYKIDRSGMNYSLEVRPPLLDHSIVERALSAPIDPTFDAEPKAILREILRKRGLGHLLGHPKRGFSLKLSEGPQSVSHTAPNSALAASAPYAPTRVRAATTGQRRALDYLDHWLAHAAHQSA